MKTLLIANRGEIAVRIARTARALGLRTVAVYSESDREMSHVEAADVAVLIGPPAATHSYLAIDRILDAARRTGADAVHPGYGFLSENEHFAQACAAASLTFVGPSPQAIRLMGDKATAKHLMLDAGVPCIPGYDGADQTDGAMHTHAQHTGYPLMVKATAGGGGKGIRLVRDAAGLTHALQMARSEAEKSFGNGTLMLEKALLAPRHVEVQVFADGHGNVVYIGDRDCSIQRRHQKVIEEAPAPNLPSATRAEMGAASVRAARAVGYVGAGTVEFLIDSDGRFYFLEMNTRLQVEHPVTEMISGLDLVEWQLRIARGEPLPLLQDEIRLTGHAIEARLCAEDPHANFLPQTGRILEWIPATGAGIRVDHGLKIGAWISSHYDSMIAKVIAHGSERDEARRRLVRALEKQVVGGVRTNRDFLVACLEHQRFAQAELSTAFLDSVDWPGGDRSIASLATQALATALLYDRAATSFPPSLRAWKSSGRPEQPFPIRVNSHDVPATVCSRDGDLRITLDDRSPPMFVRLLARRPGGVRAEIDGLQQDAITTWSGADLDLTVGLETVTASVWQYREKHHETDAEYAILAPMSGMVVTVHARPGDAVECGDILLIMEAMKMETTISARASGTVKAVYCSQGQQVPLKHLLVEIESAAVVELVQPT